MGGNSEDEELWEDTNLASADSYKVEILRKKEISGTTEFSSWHQNKTHSVSCRNLEFK